MEKRNFLICMILSALIVLLSSSAAWAERIHVVVSGDTLSAISQKYHGTWKRWKEIKADNNIADERKLRIGQKLKIRNSTSNVSVTGNTTADVKTIGGQSKVRIVRESLKWRKTPYSDFVWKCAGCDPLDPTIPIDTILTTLDYPEAVKAGLKNEVLAGNYSVICLQNGDHLAAMTFGRGRVESPVLVGVENNMPAEGLKTRRFEYEYGSVIYTLYFTHVCGNWSRGFDERIIAPPPPPQAREIVPERRPKSKPIPITEPPPEEPEKWTIEHEPLAGTYYWSNSLADGYGVWAEYMGWIRKIDPSTGDLMAGWSPGFGILGTYSTGQSKTSDYEWDEYFIGPELGIKYIAVDEDDRPWQVQGKFRIGREWTSGENSKSGYWNNQDNWKAGFYTEYIRRENEEWLWGVTGEGWWAFDQQIESSWSGDTPQSRTTLMAHVFVQKKLNENWQARFAPGIFYQDWDYLTGLKLLGELRYKEMFMFGPWLSIPINLGSDVYDGIASTSDLMTWGIFARIEGGGFLRNQYAQKRSDQVKPVNTAGKNGDWRQNLVKGGEGKQATSGYEMKGYEW